MKNLKKLASKEVKNQNAVKGGSNGKGTKKTSVAHIQTQIPLL